MTHPVELFEDDYTYDASKDDLSKLEYRYTFDHSKPGDVKVSIAGIVIGQEKFTLNPNNSVTLNNLDNPPTDGAKIRIYRESNIESLPAVFTSGSAIKAKDLNDNFNQTLWITQELTAETTDFDDIIKKYVVDGATLQGAGDTNPGDVKGLKYAVELADKNAGFINTLQTNVGNTASEGLRGIVGETINDGLQKKVKALETNHTPSTSHDALTGRVTTLEDKVTKAGEGLVDVVGDADSGLVKQVNTNEGDITSLENTVGDAANGLVQKANNNESAINDINDILGATSDAALRGKVAALESTVGDADDGLVADVSANDTAINRIDGVLGATASEGLRATAARKDTDNTYTKPQIGEYHTVTHSTGGDDIEFELDENNHFIINVNASWGKFKFTDLNADRIGMTGSIVLKYNGGHTGGKEGHMIFPGGGTPNWTSTNAKIDRIDYIVLSTSQVLCNFTADYS